MLTKTLVRGLACVSAAIALVSVGCGGSSDEAEVEGPTVTPPKYPDLAAFCNGVAQAQCGKAVLESCSPPSDTACQSEVQKACLGGQSDITVNRAVSNYGQNVAKAEPCVDAVRAAYADAKLDQADFNAMESACAPVFSAGKPKDFPCASDADCATDKGLICILTTPSGGKCKDPGTPVGKGDSCKPGEQICQAGYYCSTKESACVQKKGASAECEPVVTPCNDSLLCQANSASSTGFACADKFANQSACTNGSECASGVCYEGTCLNSVSFGTGSPLCTKFDGVDGN